jgi:hypothetical protein
MWHHLLDFVSRLSCLCGLAGMTRHQNNMLNSEGNEIYFSYDGEWQDGECDCEGDDDGCDLDDAAAPPFDRHHDQHIMHHPAGKMHGAGIFQYADGHRHEGLYSKGYADEHDGDDDDDDDDDDPSVWAGKMHGAGIFQYADGHRHEGLYRKGYADGPCVVTYPCGAVYQGYYKEGRMSGDGESRLICMVGLHDMIWLYLMVERLVDKRCSTDGTEAGRLLSCLNYLLRARRDARVRGREQV